MKHILELVKVVLPFLFKKNSKEVKEFSELIMGQYEFLAAQLERVLKDYFEVSTKVHEMHTEIFSLKEQLSEAIQQRCLSKDCRERQ